MRKSLTQTPAVADDYLKLIRMFPLRPIRTRNEYDAATKIHVHLVSRADEGLGDGEADYMQVLGRLIREYDEQHSPLLKEHGTPLDRLKFLVEEHGLNTISLGKILGSGNAQASLILNGKRELSKANIRTLAEHFKVSVAAFM